MTTETIERTIETWTREPVRAAGRPTVRARSVCSRAVIESGRFTWHADLPPALGGASEAPSPTALLLSALAADAVTLIKDALAPQMGIRVYSVDAVVSGEADSRALLGMDGVEPGLTNVNIDLRVESPEGEEAVQRLVDVWKQRCPSYLALQQPMGISISATAVDWYGGQ